jgi:rare lipoprotein A
MAKSLFAALAAVSALCAFPAHAASSGADAVVDEIQTGIASYYSRRFEGRRTASGDTFRHDALTAAHSNLPFGTIVRVTHIAKGHVVDVRITDRLPSRRAIIDLTQKAAAQLNMLRAGRAKVSVKVLEVPD